MAPYGIDLYVVISALLVQSIMTLPADYAEQRAALIQAEHVRRTEGTGQELSLNEQLVNDIIMREKKQLIESARQHGADFTVRHNFLTIRKAIERTKAFQVIKQMPKGGVLHLHDTSMTSIDWVVKNATYRPNCYICLVGSSHPKFHFYNTPPTDPDCVWRLVSELRAESADVEAFDRTLHGNISLVTPDPDKAYPDIDTVWRKFMDYFSMVDGIIFYAPVFEDYVRAGLEEFREDNVQYLEIRAAFPALYELDGTEHDKDYVLEMYQRVIGQFVQDYPDFSGVRLIVTGHRAVASMLDDVKAAMHLYARDPDLVVGFDMEGQEDPLKPLIDYIDDLLYPSQQNPPVYMPFFFHAGETNWQETATDYNLVDAVLLNTSRIGHGYALYRHPKLMEIVRQRQIVVEVNPISNQVLKLVDDPRNHPAVALIADNFPLVISSDDPAAWEALPLSDDFYVTFMALTGEDTGLATLKQLARNSLRYSALKPNDKERALISWEKKWNHFINTIVQDDSLRATDASFTVPVG